MACCCSSIKSEEEEIGGKNACLFFSQRLSDLFKLVARVLLKIIVLFEVVVPSKNFSTSATSKLSHQLRKTISDFCRDCFCSFNRG
jgi:hypothetical protein